ncbi:MAG TPA: patatin-like phospholipase family protein [Thermoclostridium sp.]|nr:patatin-like phospholipase family protein [Thermoclostridium sp.]
MKKFILSIDGGGIRGIIPAVFLTELKKALEENGVTKPFHQIFDLIAGTSTGGLISLALTVPIYQKDGGRFYDKAGGVAAEQLPVLYQMFGNKVFSGNKNKIRKTIRQVFRSKYSSTPLHNVLRDLFKNCTVKEALTNLMVTTFNMETMQPIFIKKRPLAAGGDTDPNFYMADAALSTSAVPTYFPPGYVNSIGDFANRYCLIDGGIFCNNPAMSALTEARKIFPGCEYVILSLGTGEQKEEYKTERIRNWGFFNWVAPWLGIPLITVIGEGQRISTNHMLKKLPHVRLFRLDIYLDKKASFDDGGAENIEYLIGKGKEMWNSHRDEIDSLVRLIVKKGF